MKGYLYMREYLVIFLMSLAIFVVSCNSGISSEEKIYKSYVNKLGQLIAEYENIPDETTLTGTKGIITKNEEKVKLFFEKTIKEWKEIDDNLMQLRNSKFGEKWHLDIIFCRAVLYTKLAEMNSQKKMILKTINALDDYVINFSNKEINKWTKVTLKKAIFDNYKGVFTEKLSDEENIAVIFRMIIAFQFMRLKEYDRALQNYIDILAQYPQSFLAVRVKAQIDTCRELIQKNN